METLEKESTMHANDAAISGGRKWAAYILSGLPSLFLLWDAVMKLLKPAFVVKATVDLGYPESTIAGIGVALLVSTVLYLVPRTATLGAILLTGYLGGAIAAQVRTQAVVFNIVFPAFFAGLLWGGLWLRDRRLRELLPLRSLER